MKNLKVLNRKSLLKNEGWLPVFTGFYNTIFDSSEILDNYDDIDTDNFNDNDFEHDFSIAIYESINDVLSDLNLIHSSSFERLNAPKYYNYHNDSMNITYYLNKDNILNIAKIIRKNRKEFKKYLKENYTSYDGFLSDYSNDIQDWKIKEVVQDNHMLSSIFEFILIINGYNEVSLYYDSFENLSVYDYVDKKAV